MPSEIIVPVMGESVVEATIARWLKKEGEAVSLGEPLVELETEKVNQEIAAGDSGILQKILHREGETVKIGDALGVIGAGDGASATAAPAKEASASPNGGPPPPAGTSTPVASPNAAPASSLVTGEPAADIRATPLAHRVAEDLSVPLQEVPASGPGGKVQRADVEAFAAQPATESAPTPTVEAAAVVAPQVQQVPPAPQPASVAPAVADARGETRQRLTRRRLTIARRLVEAQQTAAMLTTFNEVDMTGVMELRKKHRDAFKERHGVGLGFMSFFTKASVAALKAFPQVNAEMQGEELVFRHYHDIGIAVGDKEGLVVPVIRSAESLSFAEIEKKIAEFAEKVKSKGMTLDDLRGGTFTITNGGVFGSLVSTPILNGTQVGILGMHKIQERPVAINGEVVIRPMMYLALTYDHRVVDGREAVQFLVRVKELLEDPERLLLDG